MKKKILSTALLTMLFNIASAQNKQELLERFKQEKENNEAIFKSKQSKNFKQHKTEDISTIAVATDEFIIHNILFDNRANLASNVEALQNKEAGGFSLNGENMELAIFDGGKILDSHNEFKDLSAEGKNRVVDLENGAEAINRHATSVAGFIAAEGSEDLILTNSQTGEATVYKNGAKGILPKSKISSAGFATVNGLNVFMKLLTYNKNISNHSYGSNLGWQLTNDPTHASGRGLIYNIPTINFKSPDDTLDGAYYVNDYNYDLISYSQPKYTIVKAAGNSYGDGPNTYAERNYKLYKNNGVQYRENDLIPNDNCQNGAYCISFGSLAKNIIVVGSVNVSTDADYKFSDPSKIIHSSYSSAGPRKDGAIKPDIVAVGTDVFAPSSTSDESYSIGSGTSYSSPKVTGVVGAITQLKRLLLEDNSYYFNSDEVRALLLHTTKEAGLFEGPDNKFGWGLLDGKKAAEAVLAAHNKEIVFERNEKVSGIDYERLITANNDEELKLTFTWIDPVANNYRTTIAELIADTSSKLVNDLDVRIIDTETNEEYFPWKLDLSDVTGAAIKGDNTVDNIEQILIKKPVAGRNYKVVVSNKGNLVNSTNQQSNQNYTLLVTGAKSATLSTDDIISKSETLVYPTVAKDIVNVKTTDKIQKVDVIDLTGKLISTTKTDKVNVSSLPAGVYIINITTDKGVTTKKIVKQ